MLREADDVAERGEEVGWEGAGFELAEEGGEFTDDIDVGLEGGAAGGGGFGVGAAGGEVAGPFAEEEGEVRGELAVEEVVFGRGGLGEDAGKQHVFFFDELECCGNGAVGEFLREGCAGEGVVAD